MARTVPGSILMVGTVSDGNQGIDFFEYAVVCRGDRRWPRGREAIVDAEVNWRAIVACVVSEEHANISFIKEVAGFLG